MGRFGPVLAGGLLPKPIFREQPDFTSDTSVQIFLYITQSSIEYEPLWSSRKPPLAWPFSSKRYQGVPQGNWVQPSPPSFHGFHLQEGPSLSPNFHFTAAANMSSSVLQFGHLAGATANTSSQQFESGSPCPGTQHENDPSQAIAEEEPKRRKRINWTEEENLRLLSRWLHHSTDPVIGIDRKAEYYWKAVAQEFNDNMPANGHKRSVKQPKTHWGDVKRDLTKFCGVYGRVKNTWNKANQMTWLWRKPTPCVEKKIRINLSP
ncbi:hypothetical protein U9M48_026002 [Paspalum notatum var. saurae]|uniref:Myb-like domain-containing protein n=1 Tax=Paspalum notatum var. saurae TaxID=547442 RepID=A0AAQ3WYK1_PASNO